MKPPECGHWDGETSSYCGRSASIRLYLSGPRCPEHTPAALAGHAEPGQTAYGYTPRWGTTYAQMGAVDINKSRRGGYVSRQAALRRAAIWRAQHPDFLESE